MAQDNEWTIEFYADAQGNRPVRVFLASLDRVTKARFDWSIEQLRVRNMRATEPLVKHIEGKIWELRRSSDGNIYRLMYSFLAGRTILFLHGFQKKTQKTPRAEIDIAQTRLTDYLKRKGVNNP